MLNNVGVSNIGSIVGSIPSPPVRNFEVWRLTFNFYGLCIAIAVLIGVAYAQRRWSARGGGAEDMVDIAKWVVPAGLIGARIYHLVTDWRPPEVWIKVWEGGLGIPGGLLAAITVGYLVARSRKLDVPNAMDAAIPAVPFAHAISRLGNWFNQELYGGPTARPWGLEIDQENRPSEYLNNETFHPTFLYEAMWNIVLGIFLVRIDRKGLLKKGMILPLYILGYGVGRLIVESIRIDAVKEIWGARVNIWVSGLAIVVGLIWLLVLRQSENSHWSKEAMKARAEAAKVKKGKASEKPDKKSTKEVDDGLDHSGAETTSSEGSESEDNEPETEAAGSGSGSGESEA